MTTTAKGVTEAMVEAAKCAFRKAEAFGDTEDAKLRAAITAALSLPAPGEEDTTDLVAKALSEIDALEQYGNATSRYIRPAITALAVDVRLAEQRCERLSVSSGGLAVKALIDSLEAAQVRLSLVGAWLQRNHGTQEVNGVSCEVGVDEITAALSALDRTTLPAAEGEKP